MSRKLALALLWIVLGVATWDAVLDHEDYTLGTSVSGEEDGQVHATEDGTGKPPS